jgi:cell division septal protein FtsQ
VDVSDLHNASVILSGDPAMIQLGEDQFLTRLQSYLDLAPTLRERVADIDYVDLRFDDRIYVRPTGKKKSEVRSQK